MWIALIRFNRQIEAALHRPDSPDETKVW
jgi:hypothetical protein